MPPKKRKAADADNTPEPKRRVTRSASKTTVPAKKATEKKPKELDAKPSKPSKARKQAASPKANGTVDSEKNDSTSRGSAPTTLTISHNSMKNPITCHQYTASSRTRPAPPTLIFTHGAGGTLSAPAVVNFCSGYSQSHDVFAFQGSMNLNARVKGFHACLSHLDPSNEGHFVLGGRSMGARAAVIAATEILASQVKSHGLTLILVSYPLKGPKNDIRDKILLDLPSSVRVLFVIGEKDAMCPLDLLEETRKKMAARSKLVVVRGADHGMHVKPVVKEKQFGEKAGKLAAEWASGQGDDEEVYVGDREEG